MNYAKHLFLNKEARLFDTKEFLLKAFVAVVLSVLVSEWVPYVSGDMISLLFAMVLTLDPVNMTGIRNGFKQVEATVIGAIITGAILMIFGYNIVTFAFAIMVTIYVSLLINWREFSVVAVFTSIYMTQFVQLDDLGNPSEIETFKLRMAALIAGVLVAFVVNWLFSMFGYRHMLEKRVYHLLDDLHNKMMSYKAMLESGDYGELDGLMGSYPSLFNNVDWITGTVIDYEKDPLVHHGLVKKEKNEKILKMTKLTREMTHLNYHLGYKLSKGDEVLKTDAFIKEYGQIAKHIEETMVELDQVIHNKSATIRDIEWQGQVDVAELSGLNDNVVKINQLLKHYLK